MGKPSDIFLSYSRDNQAVAREFAEAFEQEGFSVWWDATLRSGDAYDAVTEEALATAKAVVVLWSAASVDSRWVRAEATQALRSGKLVPVMIEPCKRPVMFELTHTAELVHWTGDRKETPWLALVQDLRGFVSRADGQDAADTAAPDRKTRPLPTSASERRTPAALAKRLRWWMCATAVCGLAALALLFVLAAPWRRPAIAPLPESVQFIVPAPEKTHFASSLAAGNSAPVGGSLSPDGRMLAFTARSESGDVTLWVRPLDSIEARQLPGTEDAALPFWSPDSRSIGFFTSNRLKRIDLSGGPPVELCAISRGQGGSWNQDGVIIFSPGLRSGLQRVSAEGGEPATLLDLSADHRAYRFPAFLPDGNRFVYYVEGVQREGGGVHAGTLGSKDSTRLLESDSAALPTPPDQLLFVRQGTLFAQRLDLATLRLLGEPLQLTQPVPSDGAAPAFSASTTGVLSFRSGSSDTAQQQFTWFDRAGTRLGTVGSPSDFRGMDLSPDGERLAIHPHQGSDGDIWVIEPRGTTTRITFDPKQDNTGPVWSPDGRHIAFSSLRNGKWGIWKTTSNGDGREELLHESDVPVVPGSWSPDGRYLVFWRYHDSVHPWLLPLEGKGEPKQLFESRSSETHSQVSPDGRWIAYMSPVSGRLEIYVRSFPDGEGVVQVSTQGGVTPRWKHDGRELYYWTAYDHSRLVAIPVDGSGSQLKAGAPRELFGVDLVLVPHSSAIQSYHTFAASPDGQRFLVPVPVSTLGGAGPSTPITVVMNWTALLRKER